jgi:alpha-1,2-mannosyltransferase
MAISVLCLAALVAISVRSAASSIGPRVLAILTVVAMAKFFAHELVLGQANLAFGAICAAGLRALLHGREGAAGAWLGAATLIKPYAVLFVPYLLLTGRWRAAIASAAATALVLLLPVAVYGAAGTLDLMGDWWATATETSVPLLTNADSISVYAMYAKWIGWGRPAAVLSATTIALLAGGFLVVLVRRGGVRNAEALEVGLVLTLIPLITPQGWDYVLLLSTPLVAVLMARVPQMAPADRIAFVVALAIVAFSLYDLMGRAAYARFMGLSAITVCYLVIVAVAMRLRGARLA